MSAGGRGGWGFSALLAFFPSAMMGGGGWGR